MHQDRRLMLSKNPTKTGVEQRGIIPGGFKLGIILYREAVHSSETSSVGFHPRLSFTSHKAVIFLVKAVRT